MALNPTDQAALANFDRMPDSACIKAPVLAVLLAMHVSTVWRKAAAGELPAPVRLGPNSSGWRVGEIRTVLANLAAA